MRMRKKKKLEDRAILFKVQKIIPGGIRVLNIMDGELTTCFVVYAICMTQI